MTAIASTTKIQTVGLSVAEAIRTRRTMRHYARDPIPQPMLDELLDLALEAPSSWNLQDRHLVIVHSQEGLAALTEATGGQPQPQEAPVMVVFIADLAAHRRDRRHIYDKARTNNAWSEEFIGFFAQASQDFQESLAKRGLLREYAIKDALISASFLMLAATSFGLATSPMNGWDESLVKRAIGADHRDDIAVALLVSLGWPAETRAHPGRQPRNMNLHLEKLAR